MDDSTLEPLRILRHPWLRLVSIAYREWSNGRQKTCRRQRMYEARLTTVHSNQWTKPGSSLRREMFAILFLLRVMFALASSFSEGGSCNATLYLRWYESSYSGVLTEDLTGFWPFSDAELTNGQALQVVSSTCLVTMSTLHLDRAGRNGPIADSDIYDVMCADECVLSDLLREEAMSFTGCTCLELSTQPKDPTYHSLGDWCQANSGR